MSKHQCMSHNFCLPLVISDANNERVNLLCVKCCTMELQHWQNFWNVLYFPAEMSKGPTRKRKTPSDFWSQESKSACISVQYIWFVTTTHDEPENFIHNTQPILIQGPIYWFSVSRMSVTKLAGTHKIFTRVSHGWKAFVLHFQPAFVFCTVYMPCKSVDQPEADRQFSR